MAKLKIFTVGLELPGEGFEYVPFHSDRTLLDADISVFQPEFGNVRYDYSGYQGHTLLDQSSSVGVAKSMRHWRSELVAAANAGKLVVVFVAKPEEVYRYTGNRHVTGTGRSERVTNHVGPVSTYESIPTITQVIAKSGSSVCLTNQADFLKPYWAEFEAFSAYEAEFEANKAVPLLVSRVGSRTVGAIHRTAAGGAVLFVPPVQLDTTDFQFQRGEKTYWKTKGVQFGHRLHAAFSAISDVISSNAKVTPPPTWLAQPEFRLDEEDRILKAIEGIRREEERLVRERSVLEEELVEAGGMRRLLYEQGKPLEKAVVDALTLFGFSAVPFADGDAEFDVVFVSDEGRFLGEVEGKDTKAINIEKFSQLERNINEDFARDEVSQHAKGVLFGNAARLAPLAERPGFFTEKCLSAAKRNGAALVRTTDMFVPARYLKQNKSDSSYAMACRQAILNTSGGVVSFPSPPGGDSP